MYGHRGLVGTETIWSYIEMFKRLEWRDIEMKWNEM